jgi:hypothetical protein
MTDEPSDPFEGFDPHKFFTELRKNASVKMGAVIFGEAQMAYYDVLKGHMSEEEAFNMLAHTTEVVVKSIASAAGPLASAILQAAALWEKLGMVGQTSEKEVPGGN